MGLIYNYTMFIPNVFRTITNVRLLYILYAPHFDSSPIFLYISHTLSYGNCCNGKIAENILNIVNMSLSISDKQ